MKRNNKYIEYIISQIFEHEKPNIIELSQKSYSILYNLKFAKYFFKFKMFQPGRHYIEFNFIEEALNIDLNKNKLHKGYKFAKNLMIYYTIFMLIFILILKLFLIK